MTIIKKKNQNQEVERWQNYKVLLWAESMEKEKKRAWRTKVKLQEVELHLGNDGIPPLSADWTEGRRHFEVGQKKEFVFKV